MASNLDDDHDDNSRLIGPDPRSATQGFWAASQQDTTSFANNQSWSADDVQLEQQYGPFSQENPSDRIANGVQDDRGYEGSSWNFREFGFDARNGAIPVALMHKSCGPERRAQNSRIQVSTFPYTPGSGRGGRRRSALPGDPSSRRQVAIRNSEFACTEPGCKLKAFGSRSDLDRHCCDKHKRHINGEPAEVFPCQVTDCGRGPLDPFPRARNLEEHLRTKHMDHSSHAMEYSAADSSYLPANSVAGLVPSQATAETIPSLGLNSFATMSLTTSSATTLPEITSISDHVGHDETLYDLELKRQDLYQRQEEAEGLARRLATERAHLDHQILSRKQQSYWN